MVVKTKTRITGFHQALENIVSDSQLFIHANAHVLVLCKVTVSLSANTDLYVLHKEHLYRGSCG